MGIPDGWLEGAIGGAVLGITTTVMLATTGARKAWPRWCRGFFVVVLVFPCLLLDKDRKEQVFAEYTC